MSQPTFTSLDAAIKGYREKYGKEASVHLSESIAANIHVAMRSTWTTGKDLINEVKYLGLKDFNLLSSGEGAILSEDIMIQIHQVLGIPYGYAYDERKLPSSGREDICREKSRNIGKNVLRIMKEKGYDLERLEDSTGISLSKLKNIISPNSGTIPTWDEINALSMGLDEDAKHLTFPVGEYPLPIDISLMRGKNGFDSLGSNLRAVLRSKCMTTQEAAEILGESHDDVWNMAYGECASYAEISDVMKETLINKLTEWAAGLGISLYDLTGRKQDMGKKPTEGETDVEQSVYVSSAYPREYFINHFLSSNMKAAMADRGLMSNEKLIPVWEQAQLTIPIGRIWDGAETPPPELVKKFAQNIGVKKHSSMRSMKKTWNDAEILADVEETFTKASITNQKRMLLETLNDTTNPALLRLMLALCREYVEERDGPTLDEVDAFRKYLPDGLAYDLSRNNDRSNKTTILSRF